MHVPNKTLLQWLDSPSPDRGMHFAAPRGVWDHWSYEQLADLTLRAAAAFTERGVRHGDVVVVIQRSSPGFVASLFGAMAAGASACSVPPPFAFQRAEDYERQLVHLLTTARPALIVVDGDSFAAVAPIAERLGFGTPVLFDQATTGRTPAAGPRKPADTAILQFTSGSSGFSRGVRISHHALESNLRAMRHWLHWSPEDPVANWLPVHHDMGLIGALINIVVAGSDGWMMQPDDFIRSPLRYLTCVAENRVRLTPMPNFGLVYLLRRIRSEQLEGLNFDALRAIILGAERIDPAVLEDFTALLAPFGFDRRALAPAYGGAEATLAVTGLSVDEDWTLAVPDGVPETAAPLVGCGRPLDGVTVDIVDEDGLPLPDGTVGEIVVTGPSLASSYVGSPDSASGTTLADSVLRSGDAGFLRDGQLFVLGRLGDGLKVRGRMVFAESVEARLCELGIPERRFAVLLGVEDAVATAVVVFEKPQPAWAAVALRALEEVLEDAELVTVAMPRGGLAVTSSGKLRRRVMWQSWQQGKLNGTSEPLRTAAARELAGSTP